MESLGEPQYKRHETKKTKSLWRGEQGVLDPDTDDEEIPVATSEWKLQQYLKAAGAHDTKGIDDLKSNDDVFFVRKGTKALIIDLGSTHIDLLNVSLVKVRLLKGKHEGKAGWVMEGWVKPLSE
jgi:hypothetical protein